MLNEQIIIAVNKVSHALNVDPLTAIEKLGMGQNITRAMWMFLHDYIEADAGFLEFMEQIATDPKRNDVPLLDWNKNHTGYFSDLNSRIWGGIDEKNEWDIPARDMVLKPSFFGGVKYQAQTIGMMQDVVAKWLEKRTSYPDRWIKRKDLLRGLQARYNGDELATVMNSLIEAGRAFSKTDDEKRGRPGTLYAIKH